MPKGNSSQPKNPWSDALIEWKDYTSWLEKLNTWLEPMLVNSDHITPEAMKLFLKTLGDESGALGGWQLAFEKMGLCAKRLTESLVEAIRCARIVVYHGCRPVDAGSIHEHGLRCNNPEEMIDNARRFMAEHPSLAMTSAEFQESLDGCDLKAREGLVYVITDDRLLVKCSSHYALYGSEWLLCFFANKNRAPFKEYGVPTIVEVHIPLHVISKKYCSSFAASLLEHWCKHIADRYSVAPLLDCSFAMKQDIPPEWIAGHVHPAIIRDPYNNYKKWHNPFLTCRYCEK